MYVCINKTVKKREESCRGRCGVFKGLRKPRNISGCPTTALLTKRNLQYEVMFSNTLHKMNSIALVREYMYVQCLHYRGNVNPTCYKNTD